MKTAPTSKRFIDESELPKVRFGFSIEDRVGDLVIWNHGDGKDIEAVTSLLEQGFNGKIYRYRLLHLSWDLVPRPLESRGGGPRFEGPTLVTGRVSVTWQRVDEGPWQEVSKKANLQPASLWIRVS